MRAMSRLHSIHAARRYFRQVALLEFLFLPSVIALVAQLMWPKIDAWRSRPGPGKIAEQSASILESNGFATDILPYAVFLPQDYSPMSSYPFLLFLHGVGERGINLNLLTGSGPMPYTSTHDDFPFVVVAPQCPRCDSWNVSELLTMLDQLVAEFAIDPDRVIATRFIMGGFGTWRLAAAAPKPFAAVAPVSGECST
jgi:poly(3-hydroxybutyrate) depolymerase